ncbi:hypothetical protein FAIPA1_210110 [Frankia sp. AiPs1]
MVASRSLCHSERAVAAAAVPAWDLHRVSADARLQDVWRHAIVQLLDDYTSVLRHQGCSAAQAMWVGRPRPATAGRRPARGRRFRRPRGVSRPP